MSEWHDIATVPTGKPVIVFVPTGTERPVFEAMASPDGEYWDPTYYEWEGKGATKWQPLPEPPAE